MQQELGRNGHDLPKFSKESGEKLIKERKRIYYFNAYIWQIKLLNEISINKFRLS